MESENTLRAQASIRRSPWRCNSQFAPINEGMVECPKCLGACEIDLTPRDKGNWPTGAPKRATCDHCEGEGEVTPDKGNRPISQPEPIFCPSHWDVNDGINIINQLDTVKAGWDLFDRNNNANA